MKKLLYITFLVTLSLSKGFTQTNATIDSLLTLLKTAKEDTNKVNHLNSLCDEYKKNGDYDKGLQYGNTGLALGKKLNFPKGIAMSYNNIGVVYANQGNYDKALENYFISLKIRETIGDKKGIANSYGNIGTIYHYQGNYDKALENYFVSLKLGIPIGDNKGNATTYNNIGVIYASQGKYDKALENHFASLKINEAIGDKLGVARSYNNIGTIYHYQSNYDKALENYVASLKIKEANGNKQGIAESYNNIGVLYDNQGNYDKALENHFASLKISKTIGDNRGIARSYNNVGLVYLSQGNYDKALENYFASLKIEEANDNKQGITMSYNNIGLIYRKQGNYDKAIENHSASLKISETIGDKLGVSRSYNNIGMIYRLQGNYIKAIENHSASLKISETIGDKLGVAMAYNNIGNIYDDQGKYGKALENYFASLKIKEAIGDKQSIASSYNNIGGVYLNQGKIIEAKKQVLTSLSIAKEIGSKDDIKNAYRTLSLTDSAAGNFKGAYEYHKLFKEMNDSIFNVESAEKTAEMTAMYDGEKKETQIKLLEKDKEKQAALAVVEKKKQQTILYSVIGGLFLVLVFAGFMYNRFKITQKQKLIIEQKEKETHKQKDIIEEKHKEITDSINYAERIQRSFLATTEMLDKYLGVTSSSPKHEGVSRSERNYFVFFRPKDVVSGDFYWAGELNNGNFAFSVADSTGHGVPGAIMSILNISSLEKSIEKETEPNQILNQTRKIIIDRLKKDGSPEGGKDGMDCSLLVINSDRTQLSFAAANNPVFIVRAAPPSLPEGEESQHTSHSNPEGLVGRSSSPSADGKLGGVELIEFRGDKMPVGKHDNDTQSFTLHTALLQKGDVIYALTDGFPDQFGGDKGKKYMIKNLKELLLQVAHLPMLEQEQKLAEEFDKWKGTNEQVDDVCVIGVRI